MDAPDLGNYIAGRWIHEAAERRVSVAPGDEQPVATFPHSGPAEAEAAVVAASEALAVWSQTPTAERARTVMRAFEELARRSGRAAELIARETGKPVREASADLDDAIEVLGRVAVSATRNGHDAREGAVRVPVGVVALFSSWFFPIEVPMWRIGAALVQGCTVVFRPSSDASACGSLVVETFERAGVPAGVVNLVHGGGAELEHALVSHPRVGAVCASGIRDFVGGIGERAARALKRCVLAAAGPAVVAVTAAADLDLAADGTAWAAFVAAGHSGSSCTQVFIADELRTQFVDLLLDRATKLHVGNPLDPAVDVGPVCGPGQRARLLEHVTLCQQEGATVLLRGEAPAGFEQGAYVAPTVLDGVTVGMRSARDEVYGPVAHVIPVESEDEVLEVAAGFGPGPVCAVFCADEERARQQARRLPFDVVHVNPVGRGARTGPALALGARYGDDAAVEDFSLLRSVTVHRRADPDNRR